MDKFFDYETSKESKNICLSRGAIKYHKIIPKSNEENLNLTFF